VVLSGIAATVMEVCSHRHIRGLAFASGVYSSVQLCLFTYLISYLNLDLGFSLVAAGLIFSVAQGAGIGGRVLWGVVADRYVPARRLLALLGFTMSLCGIAAMMFSPAWPVGLLILVCALYGASAVGWNGVYLAEVARLAPEGKVGAITGGSQFFTFFGAMAGPPVFGAIASYSGGYASGFALFALLPLVSGLQLWFSAEPRAAAQGA
jgi:MFS family permease